MIDYEFQVIKQKKEKKMCFAADVQWHDEKLKSKQIPNQLPDHTTILVYVSLITCTN